MRVVYGERRWLRDEQVGLVLHDKNMEHILS
jgi:hypothetical protein